MSECVVCLTNAAEGPPNFACSHLYCKSCVRRLRDMAFSCPMCRAKQRGIRVKITFGVYEFTRILLSYE